MLEQTKVTKEATVRKTALSWHDTELVAMSDTKCDFSSEYTNSVSSRGKKKKKTLPSKIIFWIGEGYQGRIQLGSFGHAYQRESHHHNFSFALSVIITGISLMTEE